MKSCDQIKQKTLFDVFMFDVISGHHLAVPFNTYQTAQQRCIYYVGMVHAWWLFVYCNTYNRKVAPRTENMRKCWLYAGLTYFQVKVHTAAVESIIYASLSVIPNTFATIPYTSVSIYNILWM